MKKKGLCDGVMVVLAAFHRAGWPESPRDSLVSVMTALRLGAHCTVLRLSLWALGTNLTTLAGEVSTLLTESYA